MTIGLLRLILLALKIAGVTLSGASLIGSARLTRLEAWLSDHSAQQGIRGSLESLLPRKGFANTGNEKVAVAIAALVVVVFSIFLLWLGPEWDGLVGGNCCYLPMFLVLYLIHKADSYPETSFSDYFKSQPIGIRIALVAFLVVSIIFAAQLLIVFIPVYLLVLHSPRIGAATSSIIRFLLEIAVSVIALPYRWFDVQVKRRRLESTLVAGGIVITIAAEVFDYFLRG